MLEEDNHTSESLLKLAARHLQEVPVRAGLFFFPSLN